MVLDRRSLSYAAIGLSPSWMLLDLEVRPAAADSNVSSIGIYILFIYFMSHPDLSAPPLDLIKIFSFE